MRVGGLLGARSVAEAAEAHATGELRAAQGTVLLLLEVERGVLLELLVHDVLELHGRELEDVIRRDLLGRDLLL